MKITVFGLGNVGLVAALGFCEEGNDVVGIEINQDKVNSINEGRLYLHESGLQECFERNKARFTASTDPMSAKGSDCFIICVGTPPKVDGEVNLSQVEGTFGELVKVMDPQKESVIIFRSTVPPGTVRNKILPILESSGKKYNFLYHPEFLREGTALDDFLNPHMHVVGMADPQKDLPVKSLFQKAPILKKIPYESAEMLKYLNNSFHALKVAYVNEIASLASSYDVAVPELIDAFLADTKLNISTKYFRPGFSFGGPCLTKELKAISFLAKEKHVDIPLLNSILQSNNQHLFRSLRTIEKLNASNILFFGVSFKTGTDDMRSSPMLDLIRLLLRVPSYVKKREVYVRDTDFVLENKKELADFNLLKSADAIPDNIDLVVLGTLPLSANDEKWFSSYKGTVLDLAFLTKEFDTQKHSVLKPYESL